ncbi:acyltransferase domain-containing protein [Streptomyces sp. NRRL B-1347]|uniref:acyltransferase domain-containing protein n=1 Tax=Streptomyces sp. NRRL B-1347 TaxID=1476877 RepID=UPI0006900D73|nr:acyltransferase domain-containing protein [Streptomyces sp. NRRL B-1347]
MVGRSAHTWQEADESAAACGLHPLSSDLLEAERDGARAPTGFRGELLGFVTAVALHRVLCAHGAAPTALLGHSFGHHTALTCAEAFAVGDGIRLLVAREEVLREIAPNGTGMTCLETDAKTARTLLKEADNALLGIACHNSPSQTVVCGPRHALSVVEEHAGKRGITSLQLPVPYAFHGPALAPLVAPLRDTLGALRQHPLRTPVYSAVTGRFCRDSDDLLTEMARAVAHPVLFLDAVRTLCGHGAEMFVEYGLRPMLTKLIQHIDNHAGVAQALDPRRSAPAAFAELLQVLGREDARGG